MKITTNNKPTRPTFLDQMFTVEMTGEELVRLYDLAMEHEGGPKHAAHTSGAPERLHVPIRTLLGEQVLEDARERLKEGRVV